MLAMMRNTSCLRVREDTFCSGRTDNFSNSGKVSECSCRLAESVLSSSSKIITIFLFSPTIRSSHFYQVIFYFLRSGRHYISAFPVFYLRLQFLPLQAECVIRFYLYRGIQPLHNVAQFDDGTYFRLVTSQKMHCDKCSQHTCQNKESYILFIIDSKISKNSRKH